MKTTTKWIDNYTQVYLPESRCFWTNGEFGDNFVELWADKDNVHVWAETNGDPVYGEDALRELLLIESCKMDEMLIEKVLVGDLSDF